MQYLGPLLKLLIVSVCTSAGLEYIVHNTPLKTTRVQKTVGSIMKLQYISKLPVVTTVVFGLNIYPFISSKKVSCGFYDNIFICYKKHLMYMWKMSNSLFSKKRQNLLGQKHFPHSFSGTKFYYCENSG